MATALLPNLTSALISYPEILIATFSFFFLLFLYNKSNQKSRIPTNWPILGMLPCLLSNLHNFHGWVTGILHETGCTFKFRGPRLLNMDFLITCDPANINHIFNLNSSNYPKGDEFVEIFDILGDGIFNADGESWKSQRKRAHVAMTSPNFRAFVAKCGKDKVDVALMPLMHKMAEGGCVFYLQDVFLRLTFDMTCNLVLGVDPGCLSEGFRTIPFARAVDDAMEALFLRHLVPPLWWKLMRWLSLGKERKLRDAWGVIDDFIARNIAKKKREKTYGEDLLTFYMEEDSKEASDKFLRDTTMNLMLAGRDTTGVALTWFLWLLANHPEVKSKILEELIREISNDEKARDMSKMVYLHAALCECLRLYPPVPFEHKSPIKSEDLPSGKAISNEKILVSIYSMGRTEGVWGEDCSEFKPERWISESGGLRHEPSYKFLSFNCGPRTCLGKDVAFTQMKIVAAAMISNFDVELVKGQVVEPRQSVVLHMKHGLMVRVKERIGGS